MCIEFDDARFPVLVDTSYSQSSTLQSRAVLRVEAIVAVIVFSHVRLAIQLSHP
jgi:hypothetical protein